jgi:hypothetical protein
LNTTPNNAFHLTAGLAFARSSPGECERSPHERVIVGQPRPEGCDLNNERACAQRKALVRSLLRRHRALIVALVVFSAPLPLEAQPAPKVAKIGLLTPSNPAGSGHLVESFRQGFRDLGISKARPSPWRLATGTAPLNAFAELARELVRLKPDVIVTSTRCGDSGGQATDSDDPYRDGLEYRSGRDRLRGEPRAPWRKRHRTEQYHCGTRREAAGAAEGSRPRAHPRGVPLESRRSGAILDYKETEARARSLRLSSH